VDVSQSSSEWLELKEAMDAGRLQSSGSGTPVSIVLENGSRYGQTAKLQFQDVTVDPTTGSFLLRVLAPHPSNTLMPGMYGRALLSEGTRKDAILAPQQGVTRDPKGDAIAMVAGADDKVEVRKIRVSRTIGDQWLVEAGLKAGDRVIVEGVQKVRPKTKVVAKEVPIEEKAKEDGKASETPPEKKPAGESEKK